MSRTPLEIVSQSVRDRGSGREAVVDILMDVNRELGCIPEEVLRTVARLADVSNAEIYSVLSFYSFLSTEPRGRNIVRLCSTISCRMKGSSDILTALESALGISAGETTPDNRITLETTSCIGLCDESPAMLVNDTPHTRLTPEKAREIVAGLE